MSEYIKRETVLDLFGEVPAYTGYETYHVRVHTFMCEIVPLIKDAIRKIPAEDVAPVRHGRWIQCKYMDKSAKCSECGGYYTRFTVDERYPKYCPNCGSRKENDYDHVGGKGESHH